MHTLQSEWPGLGPLSPCALQQRLSSTGGGKDCLDRRRCSRTVTAVRHSRARRTVLAVDDRLRGARPLRRALHQVFPDKWSIVFGELALHCFVVLLLTGTFLTFFYDPSDARVRYHGSYVPLDDVPMSKAF